MMIFYIGNPKLEQSGELVIMQTTLNFASKFTEDTSGESDRQLQDSDESDDEISESSVDNSAG